MNPIAWAAVLALALPMGTLRAADAPPGAAACSGCHRPAGGLVPALRGRPAEEIAAAMRAYRAGEGNPTVMGRIAKGFTDSEIEAVAAWLAAG